MTNLNKLFRNRLGIPYDEVITFENLNAFLEKTAKTIPFENLCIIENRTNEITRENLIKKIIEQNEGGLCYELNSLFYFFLIENGFDAHLIRGLRYNYNSQTWSTLGKTHVANMIKHKEQFYIVDIGFGGNSPLKLVPLNGETVTSNNGEFKVENIDSEHGDSIFYIKLKHKDKEWKIGYAFDSKKVIKDLAELNEVQKVNTEHPESNFNKKPVITRFTDKGNITLTDTSFTEWVDGELTKKQIDKKLFQEIANRYFGL
ncbi:arylamine N-acetyltransferase family protein [Niallia nealsonii]|uniref:Arylamine N-acetyltransferase n=1 Tax=Niallia nealsonii TaxID=115979 RepID=A0A2N0YZH3_9BACI|nr:arylamine N-acetyltransferase [Niallia nealsonii]PKG22661.1 arylamine N-acetyltransferase [Niallia nealsonii]